MRLLQLSEGGELSLTSHHADHIPPYAILSHTWGSDADELTFQDVANRCYQHKAGFAKVRFCGEQAKKDAYQYFWVDSCCIDKMSSAELSESINSMFRWYAQATKCYVYLQDVGTRKRDSNGDSSDASWKEEFRKSRWFTRGWTLQELLAPKVVEFFSRDRDLLGDKRTLEADIASITGIPIDALRETKPLLDFAPNERLRWLQGRRTSRKEDMAYCLLGIFNVSLAVIYGEGEQQAFARLQEKAAKRWSYLDPNLITDCSIGVQRVEGVANVSSTSDAKLLNNRVELMKALAFEQMDARHATIKSAQRLTCQWLLQHPAYLAWDNVSDIPQERSIFWINGKPGAGKSTLLKFVYAHLKKRRKSRNEILISFFFNARGDELEKTTIGMYRSLLLQLLKDAPDLQQVLDEVDAEKSSADFSSFWTLETLQGLFASAVAGLGDQRIVCVIDALDECNEKQVRDMVTQFEDLAESAIDSGTRLRICFTSRHYPEIRARKALSMVLETEDGHSHDLEMFIRRQLDTGDGEHDEQIRTRIRQKSNGVFMWAVLVVDILNKEYRKGRMWAIEQKLEEIPDGLTELLRDILQRDNVDMDALLLCLQWIIFAKRPLKLEEFYCAMEAGLTDKPAQARDPEREKTHAMARFVTSSSKGLAELTKSEKPTVQFIHESVRDFLLKDGGLCKLWPHLDGRVADVSHDQLKQCCHKYMTVDISAFAPLGQPLPKASSPDGAQLRADVNEGFPFLDYASQNVLYHANEAAPMVSQEIYLHQFPFTWWIHITNVLQPVHKHRHGPIATLPYILAERGFALLLDVIPHRGIWNRIKGERHGYPFIAAFANGQRLALESLMDPNSSVSIEDLLKDKGFGKASQLNVGDDLWIWAWKNGNWNVAKYLLTSCSQALGWGATKVHDTVTHGQDALSLAAEHGDAPAIEWLVGAGAHVNGVEGCQVPPLIRASKERKSAAIQILLDVGADVNAQGGYDGNALQPACYQGCETIVQLLLDAGADTNAQGGPFGNALQAACISGCQSIVQMLLDAGADVNAQGGFYNSALQAACYQERETIVPMLLDAGADTNAQGGQFGNALQAACISGCQSIVQMLLDAGADVNAQGGKYGSALQAACCEGRETIVQMLLHAGADVNARGGYYGNALQAASTLGHEQTVPKLLAARADVNVQGRLLGSALQAGSTYGRESIVQMLTDAGADVNAREDGNSALEVARKRSYIRIVLMLIEAGAIE